MNSTDDLVLKFQCGCPVLLDDICAVYPARMGEIANLGYTVFQQYLSLMLIEKPTEVEDDSEMKKLLKELSDFQYLLILANLDATFQQELRGAFMFFTHETAMFSLDPAQIVLGPLEEKHLLTEAKFYELRKLLRQMYFIDIDQDEIIIYADDDPAVRTIKETMRKNRAKLRKAKAKQNHGSSDLSFSDLIGSITINNCGLNMDNVWNITYYAFNDQLKRMGWRDQFNINNQAAMAGAKIKKSQLKHWMRSIASSDKN